ncbi:hypothetical protein B0H19DRAFT_1083595 [Mycena capillaripes]|nr:hypothetical protein B0H19DRAFT_1083595 [Mycena capillaripes]
MPKTPDAEGGVHDGGCESAEMPDAAHNTARNNRIRRLCGARMGNQIHTPPGSSSWDNGAWIQNDEVRVIMGGARVRRAPELRDEPTDGRRPVDMEGNCILRGGGSRSAPLARVGGRAGRGSDNDIIGRGRYEEMRLETRDEEEERGRVWVSTEKQNPRTVWADQIGGARRERGLLDPLDSAAADKDKMYRSPILRRMGEKTSTAWKADPSMSKSFVQ